MIFQVEVELLENGKKKWKDNGKIRAALRIHLNSLLKNNSFSYYGKGYEITMKEMKVKETKNGNGNHKHGPI